MACGSGCAASSARRASETAGHRCRAATHRRKRIRVPVRSAAGCACSSTVRHSTRRRGPQHRLVTICRQVPRMQPVHRKSPTNLLHPNPVRIQLCQFVGQPEYQRPASFAVASISRSGIRSRKHNLCAGDIQMVEPILARWCAVPRRATTPVPSNGLHHLGWLWSRTRASRCSARRIARIGATANAG